MNAALDFGRTFSEIFEIYKKRASVLLPSAIVIFVIAGLIAALLSEGLGGFFGQFLSRVVITIAGYIYTGIVVEVVGAHLSNRSMSFGEALSALSPVLATLIVVAFLAGLGITIGFILLIIPGCILLTRWALVAPVVVLEKSSVGEAFSRSNKLVEGNSWTVFGILITLFVGLFIAGLIFGLIFAAIGGLVGVFLALVIAQIVAAPLFSLAQTVMYFELKQIKGGGAPATAGAPMPGPAAPTPQPQDKSGSTPPPSAPPPPSA